MNRRESRGALALLAALMAGAAAQAQEVHKCTGNGQVTYQAKPCPAGDTLLPSAAAPSEQEVRDARNDLARQRYHAATGRVLAPSIRLVAAAPVPPPPSPTVTTTTTTVITALPANVTVQRTLIVRQTSTTTRTPAPPPLTNCDQLNRDNTDALARREELKAPSEVATREEMLRKAEESLLRVQQLAQASNCRLTH